MRKLNQFKMVLALLLFFGLFPFCKQVVNQNATDDLDSSPNQAGTMQEVAIIKTRHGEIVLKFFPDLAPKHVESFKKLAGSGFYDGTTFHRVIPGFMIQGGDPNSKDLEARHTHGMGGPGYNVPAEFSDRSHKRGILSAARSQSPDSAGSQFFICVSDVSHLDGQYTVYGEVLSGLEIVDKIVAEKRDSNDNPVEPITITVTIETKEIK